MSVVYESVGFYVCLCACINARKYTSMRMFVYVCACA